MNVRACKKWSTAGWEISVPWKDQRTTWESLAKIKECNPVETTEYYVMKKVDQDQGTLEDTKDSGEYIIN